MLNASAGKYLPRVATPNSPRFPQAVSHAILVIEMLSDMPSSLILFFSKSLLRHPLARSDIDDFLEGKHFVPYIAEPHPESLGSPDEIKRHILCSGQLYYALLQERDARKLNNVAISRVEQLSPVPYASITPHLDHYPNADIMWAQVGITLIIVNG